MQNGMLDEHDDVTIGINIMYINEIPFMMTTSQTVHLGTL